MPVLDNQRWEKFARGLAEGKTGDEAYQLAGYMPNRHNASRLKTTETILNRVAELKASAATSTVYTVERIARMLEEDRALAHSVKQLGPAVAASTALAKLHGHMVDRKEVGLPGEFDNLTLDQKVQRANGLGRQLGISRQSPVAGTA